MTLATKSTLSIVCALNCEAKPWIERYALKKSASSPFDLYESVDSNIRVLISGIGALSTAAAIGWLGARLQSQGLVQKNAWLNVGIAGHASLDIATPVRVHAFVGEESLRKHFVPLTAKWAGHTCAVLSVNAPSNACPSDMMVDMEAFAFYQSAILFSSAELVQSIKVISDNKENDVNDLDAGKITALMRRQVDTVDQFATALLSLPLAQSPTKTVLALTHLRATHSQEQQLNTLLNKVAVLGIEPALLELELESAKSIKEVLRALQTLVASTVPSLTLEQG